MSVSVRVGVAPALQIVHGQAGPLAVVNDHEYDAAIVLPATSFTPAIVAVYAVPVLSGTDGVNVAELVPES